MKTFIKHELPSLLQINEGGKRTYQTPDGANYPSVTTVTSWYSAPSIQEWRKKVGPKEANRICKKASTRGTAIHELCENYLKHGSAEAHIADVEVFTSLKPHLDLIDNIHCLENRLFSHKLKVAGTVDCIAEYDGQLSIIDFKTSAKPKKIEWIDNYFMQTAAYSYMFWEMTGILVDNCKVIIGVDDHDPQVFDQPVNQWLKKFIQVRQDYKVYCGI